MSLKIKIAIMTVVLVLLFPQKARSAEFFTVYEHSYNEIKMIHLNYVGGENIVLR